ncbi:helix-turn-helix domain-containing protein [Streptomyces sp. NPDC088785]|uniref:helix-turn-helix domain-containing protein n=1 Tax=Streptomyces sp. NPDC088785 TaxID=3365897 RepID=UPI00382D4476
MSATSAALQRLRLRTELRRARLAAELTQREVAKSMEWSPSKLIRIEAGEVGVSVNDLRPLLAAYGITDRRKIDELLDLARGSRKMPFAEYRDLYGKEMLQFLSLESAAWITRHYSSLVIPGVLQTEEYMRATMRAFAAQTNEDLVDRAVEARLARQELLDDTGDRQLFFILDESVLRRSTGGPGVMRAQLERLAELSAQPHITLQILPFSAGAHPAIQGPFTLFEFRVDEMEDALFIEDSRGIILAGTSPEETRRYLERFWELEDLAVKEDVEKLLRRLAGRVEAGSDDLLRLLDDEAV